MKLGFEPLDLSPLGLTIALAPGRAPSVAMHVAEVVIVGAAAGLQTAEELSTVPMGDLMPVLNRYLAELDYAQLGRWDDAQWNEVHRADVEALMLHGLTTSLAYGARLLDADEARGIVQRFLGLLPAPARYAVSSELVASLDAEGRHRGDRTGFGSGRGLTSATLEQSVIVLSHAGPRVGVCVFTDED